jgi:PAS domain S-box-containing protein
MIGENFALELAESLVVRNSKLNELRVIVEACPLATFISDENGSCVYVNKAYQELVGRSYHECLEDQWKALINPAELDAVDAHWRYCVSAEKVYDYDYRIVRPGGELVPVHVHAQPLPSGGFVGYINATNGANCRFICAARASTRNDLAA